MRLVDLIPLQEIDFASQKGFDAYNKAHKLRPDTKVTIAGKKTTAGQASKVKGTSVFAKDKEQKKSFKDLGIDRDSAVNAHLDAKKAAKGEEPAKINSNFSMDVVKMLRKANISDVDDNTTKLLSKLQKVKGETVADTKTGKVSYFLYDGSRYEMNIDVKNKSIRTKELKPTGGGNKPKKPTFGPGGTEPSWGDATKDDFYNAGETLRQMGWTPDDIANRIGSNLPDIDDENDIPQIKDSDDKEDWINLYKKSIAMKKAGYSSSEIADKLRANL